MTPALAIDWVTRLLGVATEVGGPVVLVVVVVGLFVAVLQAATQVNDAAVGFAPKLVAMLACVAIGGEWMLARLGDFTTAVLLALASVGHAASP
jgi:flagellar biosynthetic protein FliQ